MHNGAKLYNGFKANDDAGKCVFCETTTIDYNNQLKLLVDGKRIFKGLCYNCTYEMGHNRIYFCHLCQTLYEATEKWVAAVAAENVGGMKPGMTSTLVCPKHSESKKTPKVKCKVCKKKVPHSMGTVTTVRGWTYCITCADESPEHDFVICAAPYCGTFLLTTDPDVVSTPAGQKHYCPDCSLVRTAPPGSPHHWHPLSWDYRAGCGCSGCQGLAGKGDKWPAIDVPDPDVKCAACKEEIHSSIAKQVDDIYLCHVCETLKLRKCTVCGKERPNGMFHKIYSKTKAAWVEPLPKKCDPCVTATDKFWYCQVGCLSWYPNSMESCHCDGVYNYTYTPPKFNYLVGPRQRVSDDLPYMGLELEVEAQKGDSSKAAGARLVHSLIGKYAYCVHDGTLSGEGSNYHGPDAGGQFGFEIVTHPFTFEWFQNKWDSIEHLLTLLANKGYRSWEGGRCGIHIHVSRKPMSHGHQRKFINFFYGSTNLALCIGQRSYRSKGIAKYAPFDVEKRSLLMNKVRHFENPGVPKNKHYTAINTNKRNTIEARWFRGTLNPSGVRKNVEFIDSVWHFTRIFGHTSANEINYIDWLRSVPQSRRYSTLIRYIEHNYITRR